MQFIRTHGAPADLVVLGTQSGDFRYTKRWRALLYWSISGHEGPVQIERLNTVAASPPITEVISITAQVRKKLCAKAQWNKAGPPYIYFLTKIYISIHTCMRTHACTHTHMGVRIIFLVIWPNPYKKGVSWVIYNRMTEPSAIIRKIID